MTLKQGSILQNNSLIPFGFIDDHTSRFVCGKCGSSYKHKKNLNTHIKNNCNTSSNYECPKCPYKSCRRNRIKEHYLRMHKFWKSTEPNTEYNAFHEFVLNPLIDGRRPYKCDKCGLAYSRHSSFVQHLKMDCENARYECPHCSYVSGRNSNLKRHLLVHRNSFLNFKTDFPLSLVEVYNAAINSDNSGRIHVCEKCGVAYKHKSNLANHISTNCNQLRKHRCTLCPYASHLPWRFGKQLLGYMNSHSQAVQVLSSMQEAPEEYKCPNCTKVYKSQSGLYTHRHYECGIEPQFRCLQCPYRTHHKHSLKRHYRLKHNLTVAVSSATGIPVKSELCLQQPFIYPPSTYWQNFRQRPQNAAKHFCPGCRRPYETAGGLYTHMRFECLQQLPSAYWQNSSQRSANGAMHFCPGCRRPYETAGGLYNHVKFKCGKEPQFSCEHCHFRFYHKQRFSFARDSAFSNSGFMTKQTQQSKRTFPPEQDSNVVWTDEGLMYQCQKCLKLYMHNQSVRRHLRYECGQERQFKCNIWIQDLNYYGYEENSVFKKQQHQCNQCGKIYCSRGNVSRHKKYQCGVEPKFLCGFCPYRARLKSDLGKHFVGDEEVRIVILYCDSFKNPAARNSGYHRHVEVAGLYPFQCYLLLKPPLRVLSFNQLSSQMVGFLLLKPSHRVLPFSQPSSQVNRDVLSTFVQNKSENMFRCEKCKRVYKHRHNLIRHLRYECGVEPSFKKKCSVRKKLKMPTTNDDGFFQCKYCFLYFETEYHQFHNERCALKLLFDSPKVKRNPSQISKLETLMSGGKSIFPCPKCNPGDFTYEKMFESDNELLTSTPIHRRILDFDEVSIKLLPPRRNLIVSFSEWDDNIPLEALKERLLKKSSQNSQENLSQKFRMLSSNTNSQTAVEKRRKLSSNADILVTPEKLLEPNNQEKLSQNFKTPSTNKNGFTSQDNSSKKLRTFSKTPNNNNVQITPSSNKAASDGVSPSPNSKFSESVPKTAAWVL
ncbi:zinc finger protein 836-like [Ctenocephalides felis]|uniref:zinc finger protein 836-like n=1 Tax=Ctenocephalides felis TaxID=7515 RepID=UPI000E6E332B|nr:zinc finger protein 836-like [Ctenocephalides felis]